MASIAPHKDPCPPGSHDSPEILITSVSSNLNEELASPLTPPSPLPEDEVQAIEEHGPLPQNDTAAFLLLWVVGIVLAPLACAMYYAGYQIFQQFSLDKWMDAARENVPTSVPITVVEMVTGMIWAATDQEALEMDVPAGVEAML